ncbi:ABC transporter substrate-binding protein [Pseudoroseomonas rhizosphaerae]|uniref:ABC transporter substrate-binding protein n=1 Tax=Teichococcus rhizosphaerae TaxID=1335062 RepID=A0A2C7A8R4_9PROT|nr:ABC transporter substrate-binding protein [Pseudoroseomonas rhizosphaerae]PHK94013.1 ABC transporter substrate-binding protein [Pseudoroseomonas rhizosphaerae]
MMISMRAAAMAAVSAFGLSLAAPVASAQNLTMAVGAQVTSLDPHYHALSPNLAVATMLFDTLTAFDAEARVEPGLAESWRVVEPTVWEFKLRPGVKFHNGNAFTAEDVAFTIARVPTVPNSPSSYAIYTRAIERVEIVDPLTVRLHTRTPYPVLPNDLGQVAILDKETHEGASTEDFNSGKVAVGTGPFRYVNFRSGDRLELERNDAYWGDKPHWAKVSYRILPNDASRTAALLAGDVDFIDQVPTSDLASLRRSDKVHLAEKDGLRIIFLALDHQHPEGSPQIADAEGKPLGKNPLHDLRVRRALSIAIDRPAIASRVMEGTSMPSGQFLPPTAFGAIPDLAAPKTDPDAAKKLLAEAGYPNGFRITLSGPNDRYMNDARIVQAIGQMWTRIGVRTQVDAQPWTTFIGRAGRQELSAFLVGWGSSSGEASNPLRSLVAGFDRDKGFGTSNRGRYSNPEVDAKLEAALRELDDTKREALLRDATRLAMEDVAIIPIHIQKNLWAMRPTLRHDSRADELTRAQDVRPAPAQPAAR